MQLAREAPELTPLDPDTIPELMSDRNTSSLETSPYLPVLLALFVGSGCAALIYEIVWFQLLQLTIGSSAVSLGVLLGTFMGGMCLGSFVLPRYIDVKHHPLKVYACLLYTSPSPRDS